MFDFRTARNRIGHHRGFPKGHSARRRRRRTRERRLVRPGRPRLRAEAKVGQWRSTEFARKQKRTRLVFPRPPLFTKEEC